MKIKIQLNDSFFVASFPKDGSEPIVTSSHVVQDGTGLRKAIQDINIGVIKDKDTLLALSKEKGWDYIP